MTTYKKDDVVKVNNKNQTVTYADDYNVQIEDGIYSHQELDALIKAQETKPEVKPEARPETKNENKRSLVEKLNNMDKLSDKPIGSRENSRKDEITTIVNSAINAIIAITEKALNKM